MVWTARISDAGWPGAVRFMLSRGTDPVAYAAVIEAWRTDTPFRSWFNAILVGVSFSAFRWETPPVSAATASQPFEFVVLDSPGLASDPDPDAFHEHFRGRSEPVLTFPNLGKDALMVVPRPVGPASMYAHLAAFVRNAPESQRDALWQTVGNAMAMRLGAKPVWLSTAGGGISWLHVRLDDRPKYYGFGPYRHAK
jgi:hypothetical protein